jgi:transaldolase
MAFVFGWRLRQASAKRRHRMLFLDSSDVGEIREIFSWGVVAGVTTNPLLLAREAPHADLEQLVRAILGASTGHVSVELTTENEQAMLDEAQGYYRFAPDRIAVKVPFSEIGLKVTHGLAKQGVTTNVTCLMSFNQAYLAALAGGTYVSIFSGRVRDMGYDVRPIIAKARELIDREGLASKIIVGSIRHIMDVNEALEAGAHIVTVPPGILRKMLHNPKTDETVREFNAAWHARGK